MSCVSLVKEEDQRLLYGTYDMNIVPSNRPTAVRFCISLYIITCYVRRCQPTRYYDVLTGMREHYTCRPKAEPNTVTQHNK